METPNYFTKTITVVREEKSCTGSTNTPSKYIRSLGGDFLLAPSTTVCTVLSVHV